MSSSTTFGTGEIPAVSVNLSETNLFKPIKVGSVELQNRLAYAPTTRIRNLVNGVPTNSVLEYYRRRAENNGGLLIFEATAPHSSLGPYKFTPVIETKEQVSAFAKIIDAVHKEGSKISVQLWSLGRTADAAFLKENGYPFKAPSAIYFDEESEKKAKEAGNELQEMTKEDIKNAVKHFAEGAKRAIDAGADFIEIHGAHGYLVDQFIQESSNHRTDEYGGSIENRARFALEVVDACIAAVGAEHVGIRLSPYAYFQGSLGLASSVHPIVMWGYILSELERRAKEGKKLAYVSMVEPRVSGVDDNVAGEKLDLNWAGNIWSGILVTAGAHLDPKNIQKIKDVVNRDDRTIVAVGRYYTSNPDLANRLKNGWELTAYDRQTFYNPMSNVGYLNFTKYGEEEDHSFDDKKVVGL
ncbi:NADPH dehydrogenase [Martiniozyma asiatica (nom. inval.)]|nr:NADPH dehydrogenase [Martiniozyma asiatica]